MRAAKTKGTAKVDSGAFERRFGFNQPLYGSYGHTILPNFDSHTVHEEILMPHPFDWTQRAGALRMADAALALDVGVLEPLKN